MKYPNLKAFQKHLASASPHNLCRVYLISVADDFERNKILDGILRLVAAPDAQPNRFSGTEFPLREFLTALDSPSLFGGETVVVLDDAEKIAKKVALTLEESLTGGIPGYLLIGSRSKTPLAAWVEKQGVVLDLTEEKPWDKEKRVADGLSERARNAGKKLSGEAVALLFEQLDKDAALLESEIDKLICYVGEREFIQREDVLAISASSRTHTLWQIAEAAVWEGGDFSSIDAASFHGLIPSLRSQLQLGLKISTLVEMKLPQHEWSSHLPKVWPKTLEKRTSQAARLGTGYFRKALDKLFEIELLSRNNSSQYAALLDFFRAAIHVR